MWKFRVRALVALSILVLGSAAAGGVVAASQPSDEQALRPTRQPAERGIESRVNRLLARMTLEEKLEQIQLLPDFLVTEDEVRNGLGSVLSVTDPVRIRELQRIAVEQAARDDKLLDFVRAFAEDQHGRVAVDPLDDELLRVAVAAVDAHRLERDLLGGLGGEELRHARLEVCALVRE